MAHSSVGRLGFAFMRQVALFLAIFVVSGHALAVSNTFAIAPDTAARIRQESFYARPGSVAVSAVQLEANDRLQAEIHALKLANTVAELKILQIGIGRDVAQGLEASSAGLRWGRVPGGMAAHWSVTSPGARALRIGLDPMFIAPGVEIRFAGEDGMGTVYGPFRSPEIHAMGATYWSPVLEGDNAIVEVFVPDGGAPADVVMAISRVSHLLGRPRDADLEAALKIGESQSCEIDLICRSATDAALASVGKAVARMVFTTSTGGSALCTGTLLNPRSGTLTPYFYSAAHCFSTQTPASTLTTHWFYDRATCGTGGVQGSYTQLTGGATLLFANTTTDVLLLRLNATPPAGAIYAGWDSTAVTTGAPTVAVHHPAGDVKKVSLGTIGGFSAYGGGSGSTHIIGLWNGTSTGVTEGGSSGSGLFTAVGSPATEYQLRGGLHGGPSSCTATGSALRDYYSRFDQAYPSISPYLDPGTPSCTYSLSPTSALVAATSGAGSFTVSTTSGCAWTATSNASWITTSSTGTGSGTALYSVSANTGLARSGTVIAGGQIFTVTQAVVAGGWNGLVNGDFESGATIWTQSGSVITNNVTGARAGAWYALLGGANSAIHDLYQDVAIPGDAHGAAIQFWYRITTAETSGTVYDRLVVSLHDANSGAILTNLATFTNLTPTAGWVQSAAYDISAFKGQTVRLKFAATTDSVAITSFRIDDVALTVVGGTMSYGLSVYKAGTGSGTVISSPAGITCGPTCSAVFSSGTLVTLSAAASAGSTFAGWSGPGCSGTSTCAVTMSAAASITATFTSSANTCTPSSPFPTGPAEGLQAFTFSADWSSSETFSATFWRQPCSDNPLQSIFFLRITPTTGSPFVCGSSFQLISGGIQHSVRLLLSAAGSSFCTDLFVPSTFWLTNWSFDPFDPNLASTLIHQGVSLTSSGAVPAYASLLTVSKSGSGTGIIVSSPAGITCGTTCSASFVKDTLVALTGTPASGSTFTGWSGGGCNGTGGCTLTMNAATTVTATFTLKLPSTTSLISGANPATSGQSVTFTATVSGSGATPSGTVTFKNGTTTICATVALASGQAQCTTSGLSVASHSITAEYSGDAAYLASTSSALTQVVNALTVPVASPNPTSIDFGGQSMGTTSASRTVTVTNAGGATLTISAVSVSNSQFAQTNNCTAVAPSGTCTITLTFSPASVAGALNSTAAVTGALTITSNGTGSPNTVSLAGTGEKSLVAHYYRAILNRAPEAGGKAFWDSEATRLSALGANITEIWFVMANYFFNSPEYLAANKTNTAFMIDVYNTFFNRPPDQGGFDFWMSQMNAGLSREGVIFWFMFSNEFRAFNQAIFGNTAARPEVDMVMDLFRGILNRFPDTPAFNAFVGTLRSAQCQAPAARAGAVYTAANDISYYFLFGSAEYANRARTNTQFVSDMYNAFLRRGGTASEVAFWINQLNTGAKDRNRVRADFIASPEFGARVSAVIAAGCAQ